MCVYHVCMVYMSVCVHVCVILCVHMRVYTVQCHPFPFRNYGTEIRPLNARAHYTCEIEIKDSTSKIFVFQQF